MVRRSRRQYDRVSATAEDEDDNPGEENEVFVDEHEEEGEVNEDVEAGTRRGIRGRRRQYQTVRSNDEDDNSTVPEEEEEEEEEEGTKVTIVILDPAQKKFFLPAYTHWTVAKLKERGERVHKVPPPSQRLIYRGGMLQDNKTLEECKLNTDKLIVHLFPKPRVVIQQSNNNNNSSCTSADEENQENSGAHIPQIVLNPDEAEQRAHILVLGSPDFLEAQNNVKLFSFLLLVISSIELMNLLMILMGVTPDDTNNGSNNSNLYASEDDFFSHHDAINNSSLYSSNPYGNGLEQDPYQEEAIQQELQTWHPRNNVDFVISAFGVYVAMLGIRATNETTLLLARQYLLGTVAVGIAWMMFNYWFTVHVDEEFDELRREERHNYTAGDHNSTDPPPHYDDDAIPYRTDTEYYQQNLSLMMIPGMVWCLCCIRAWQFQSLLEEAEREAEERIRNELAQHTANVRGTDTLVEDDGATDEDGGSDIELSERTGL